METRDMSAAKAQTQGLIARLAGKFGVEPNRLLKCLTTQVFKQADGRQPTNEELMVLLLVCENFALNPFNREIYAFRGKGGDIVPVVSLDGWAKIVRSQKDFNGVSFRFSETTVKVPGCAQELPEFVECAMRLKGVDEPIVIQEFMIECFNEKSPVWRKWPRRMLRTRAFIQCARLAFSLTGIYDEGDHYRTSFYDGWITDRGWTDYCVFFHEESKDGLPVLIFFYNPSKDPNDDLWYASAYILSNGVFMGSEGILDSSERIDRRFESIKKWV